MRDHEDFDEDQRTIVERIVGQDLDASTGKGRPLSSRARQRQRSIEAYIKAGVRPRWMERVAEIDAGIARERRRLARAHRVLREECAGDEAAFARLWLQAVRSWPLRDLNELVDQHNQWYPIERQLAVNPRTGEYVRIAGRSYRRPVLDETWVLDRFPANLGANTPIDPE